MQQAALLQSTAAGLAEVEELTRQLKALKEQLSGMESRLGEAKDAERAAQQAVRAAEQCFDQAERQASLKSVCSAMKVYQSIGSPGGRVSELQSSASQEC